MAAQCPTLCSVAAQTSAGFWLRGGGQQGRGRPRQHAERTEDSEFCHLVDLLSVRARECSECLVPMPPVGWREA